MRLFIALALPTDVLGALQTMQQQLRRSTRHPVKWVSPQHMHMTLQFLGEVDDERVQPIWETLNQVAQANVSATQACLHLAPAGAFPNLRRPQTIWAGVGGNLTALETLQQAIAHAMQQHGFAPENKPFRAHLTLGRVRREATPQQRATLGTALETLPQPHKTVWQAGAPILFQSTLTPDGPIYRKVGYE
jgi:2'-5' RNA ligase